MTKEITHSADCNYLNEVVKIDYDCTCGAELPPSKDRLSLAIKSAVPAANERAYCQVHGVLPKGVCACDYENIGRAVVEIMDQPAHEPPAGQPFAWVRDDRPEGMPLISYRHDRPDVPGADAWFPVYRAAQPPSPVRQPSKFDLAFEIMRQLEAEDMETMQSCQFGYVMRVTREGHGGQVEFRPIETAPKDGSTILLRCPKGIVEGCWEQVDGGGHPENGPPIYWWTSPFTEFIDGPYDAPTHWALIPRDAPTKESAP